MAKTEVIGSWYNSGFHGHFRSKSRNDFINEYRHLAKPIPPKTFIRRSREPSARHVFSTHDNRQAFLNDALIFSEGLGRRRIANNTTKSDRALLHWWPMREEFSKQGPDLSSYKKDYRGVPFEKPTQLIINRPKTSFDKDQPTTTSYRYSHGTANPNRDALNAMSNVGLSTAPNRIIKSSVITGRESVASCLSWHRPSTPIRVRTGAPPATQTVTIDPPCVRTAPAAAMRESTTVTSTQVHVPHPPCTAPPSVAPPTLAPTSVQVATTE